MKTNQALVEAVLKSLIVEEGPQALVTALNNACCHGGAIIEYGCNLNQGDPNDKVLNEWFDGIELLAKAAKKFEKMVNI